MTSIGSTPSFEEIAAALKFLTRQTAPIQQQVSAQTSIIDAISAIIACQPLPPQSISFPPFSHSLTPTVNSTINNLESIIALNVLNTLRTSPSPLLTPTVAHFTPSPLLAPFSATATSSLPLTFAPSPLLTPLLPPLNLLPAPTPRAASTMEDDRKECFSNRISHSSPAGIQRMIFSSKDGIVSPESLNKLFSDVGVEGHKELNKERERLGRNGKRSVHKSFNENLAQSINHCLRIERKGMRNFKVIEAPILREDLDHLIDCLKDTKNKLKKSLVKGLSEESLEYYKNLIDEHSKDRESLTKHTIDSDILTLISKLPTHTVSLVTSLYQSWIKINDGEIHLKIGKVAAPILAQGTTKLMRSLYSFIINLKKESANFTPEISLTFRYENTRALDFEDFKNGMEIQKNLLEKHPNLCIAKPVELLHMPEGREAWMEAIWSDRRYHCDLSTALEKGSIKSFNGEMVPFKLKDFLDCMISTSHTLRVIHEEGFVHRDIKFDNILLVSQDVIYPKLIDFNLASRIGGLWENNEGCLYWDSLANKGYGTPLTDCFSLATALDRYFFKGSVIHPPYGEILATLPTALMNGYVEKLQHLNVVEASIFAINPENYLRNETWKAKLSDFFIIGGLPGVEKFLDLINELKIAWWIHSLIVQIINSTYAFNKQVESGYPDAVFTHAQYTDHIQKEYNRYGGFKMFEIWNMFCAIKETHERLLKEKELILRQLRS